jgi:hypothetical protein
MRPSLLSEPRDDLNNARHLHFVIAFALLSGNTLPRSRCSAACRGSRLNTRLEETGVRSARLKFGTRRDARFSVTFRIATSIAPDHNERIYLRVTAGVEVRWRPRVATRWVCGAAPSFLSERQ